MYGVRVNERTLRVYCLHLVAEKVDAEHIDLLLHHVSGTYHEIAHGNVLLDRIGIAVNVALAEPGQVQHGLSQGFAGGAGVDVNAAQHGQPFQYRYTLVEFRRLDCSPLAGRPRTDDNQVVVIGSHRKPPSFG